MPLFAYRARGPQGELLEGTLECVDANAAASQLVMRGMTPVHITRTRSSASISLSGFFQERITPLDVMLFSRQMYALLRSGVPIMRALTGLQESATNKRFAGVLRQVRESLDGGQEVAASLAQQPEVFNSFFVNMVRVGEMTGRLDEIFLRMFHHLEFARFMRDQVRSAIRYPVFVMASIAAAFILINLFVIPAFARVYEGLQAKLPAVTQVLIKISEFMVASWPVLLLGVAAVCVAVRLTLKTRAGKFRWDRLKLRLPIAGRIVLKATLARFARSFALALRSGLPVVQALAAVTQTVDNEFVAEKIAAMRDGVERGESVLGTASRTGVFTPVVLQMIAVGEESGSLDELIQEVADMYQRDVEYEVKTLSSQIEPLLISCLAVLVLVMALGVFLPIWDLGRAMGR